MAAMMTHSDVASYPHEERLQKKGPNVDKMVGYLIKNVEYYSFCNECMGSENEITKG